MDLQRVGLLAPCEGLGDFPTHFVGADADAVLNGWCAAWRPSLIAASGAAPVVIPAYQLPSPDDWADGLVIAPSAAVLGDDLSWLDSVRAAQESPDRVVDAGACRKALVAAIDEATPGVPTASAELDAEFFALGYAYLQVATLTHDLEYGSVFDPTAFEHAVVEAASAAVNGNDAEASAGLNRCYDQLLQARHHTYPVDIFFVDVLLVAESTLGREFVSELESTTALNVMLSGRLAEAMAQSAPAAAAALRAAIAGGSASVFGGGYTGDDLSALPPEAMLADLRRGMDAIQAAVGATPRVFGQRATSAAARLPQLVTELGFVGTLLNGFDGFDPPTADQGRTTWMGIDGVGVEAIVGTPRDVGRPETLLGLSEHLIETLERDHAATIIFAGWPGARNAALDDLRRVAARSEVLGRFVSLEEYFAESDPSHHWAHVDPGALGPSSRQMQPCSGGSTASRERDRIAAGLAGLAAAVSTVETSKPTPEHGSIKPFVESIGSSSPGNGLKPLVVNPWSFATPAASLGVVTPALGFVGSAPAVRRDGPPRARDGMLQNEHLAATVHEESGGLRSLRRHDSRTNRLSQRLLVVRRRATTSLAEMRARRCEVIEDSPTSGAIRSEGNLVDTRGRATAAFEQTLRLDALAEWLTVDIRIEPGESPQPLRNDAWLVARLAFGDDTWQWTRGLQWAALPIRRTTFVAGDYLAVQGERGAASVAVQTPTLFRRAGGGQVDVVLPWSGEEPAQYRIALGVDSLHPLRSTLAGLGGVLQGEAPYDGGQGWWLHSSAANVVVSHLEADANDSRRFRARLVETEGRGANALLRFCRPLLTASHRRFSGDHVKALTVVDGAAEVEIGPYGWLEVEATW